MEALASALQQLGQDEYELFEALFFDELTEAQYARKLRGVPAGGQSEKATDQKTSEKNAGGRLLNQL